MNVFHYSVKPSVHFFEAPRKTLAVLAHFQAAYRNAARVGRFSGSEQNASILEFLCGFDSARHVRAFRHQLHSVFNERVRIASDKLVLRGTRERAVNLDSPRLCFRREFRLGIFFDILVDSLVSLAEFFDVIQFLLVDSVFIVNESA